MRRYTFKFLPGVCGCLDTFCHSESLVVVMLLWEVRGTEQVEGIVKRLKRNLKDSLPPGLKSGPWKVATVKLG